MKHLEPMIRLYPTICAMLLALFTTSCSTNHQADEEPKGPFPGTWKITKVMRNLDDITSGCDFGPSLITLNADGTYTVDKTAPFTVTTNGQWSLKQRSGDDIIILHPTNVTPFEMRYDTSGGTEKIIAEFSTGSGNHYRYLLRKTPPTETARQ